MAARTDHIRLDAEHAARLEISKAVQRYVRRMYEEAKADIAKQIADAPAGSELDGTRVGEEAVRRVIAGYLGAADASPAIEAGAASESS